MTTDTNQASEDELENLIRNNIHTFSDEYLELDECVDAIQALIRTEKLKLLDRLEKQATIVTSLSGEKAGTIDLTAIEAERTKLEAEPMSKDTSDELRKELDGEEPTHE